MKRKSRRTLALICFVAIAAVPVALAIVAAGISTGGTLSRKIAQDLGGILDMKVSIDGVWTPSPTSVSLEGVRITPHGPEEPLATFQEVQLDFDPEARSAVVAIEGGTFQLGSGAGRRHTADALGRLVRKKGYVNVTCSVKDVVIELPGAAPVLEVRETTGIRLGADEDGRLSFKLENATADYDDELITIKADAELLPRGELTYHVTVSRSAGDLLPEAIGEILGEMCARCIRSFDDGLEVLSIVGDSVERSFRGELSLNLVPLYEELALADTYNAIETPLDSLVLRDGEIAALELVIRHDVLQLGKSALSLASGRLLRTIVYLGTGEELNLRFDREKFQFNDFELAVSVKGDTIQLTGKVSRQGQWIALAGDSVDVKLPNLPGEPVTREEFAARWQEAIKRNGEGWPGETPSIAPVEVPNVFDIFRRLGGAGQEAPKE